MMADCELLTIHRLIPSLLMSHMTHIFRYCFIMPDFTITWLYVGLDSTGTCLQHFVKRWKPEANTFYLPPWETTMTLQDVAVITELCVDGPPADAAYIDPKENIRVCFERLMGQPPSELRNGAVSLTWLHKNICTIPPADAHVFSWSTLHVGIYYTCLRLFYFLILSTKSYASLRRLPYLVMEWCSVIDMVEKMLFLPTCTISWPRLPCVTRMTLLSIVHCCRVVFKYKLHNIFVEMFWYVHFTYAGLPTWILECFPLGRSTPISNI